MSLTFLSTPNRSPIEMLQLLLEEAWQAEGGAPETALDLHKQGLIRLQKPCF